MRARVIPIEPRRGAGSRVDIVMKEDQIEALSLAQVAVSDGNASLRISEASVEEFVRKHIGVITPPDEDETLLVVG